VVGLDWAYDPESYAGGSVVTGRVSHDGQVKGDDSDKKRFLLVQLNKSPKALKVTKIVVGEPFKND
jgi:hypothetical protein